MDQRFAILGDIHANIEALEAVLADAREQGVTSFICLGDIVGYNASPCECVETIRNLDCVCIRGNHDHYCSHDEELDDFQPLAASVIAWTRRQLNDEQGDWLSELPLARLVSGFTIVHSTLDMPERWGYVFDLLDAEAHFNYQTTTICFHGHTHVPVIFQKRQSVSRHDPADFKITFGAKYFVNVGSVGQPRDGDPRSAYVIYTPKTKSVTFRRVPYDLATAMDKVRRAGLPERLAQRLELGR